eukprot:jgi/Ulvmu1/7113/UM034_0019.1
MLTCAQRCASGLLRQKSRATSLVVTNASAQFSSASGKGEEVEPMGTPDIKAPDFAAAESSSTEDTGIPPLLVFGGSGFVGTHVCQEAIRCGLPVTSISRSGRPANEREAWADAVTWECADALQPESYSHLLASCLGVVSCIGLISPSSDDMLRVNGAANERIIAAAADAGVQRLAYVSAHDFKFPGDLWVMRGYFQGKRNAEAALRDRFPTGGVALRPGVIYGTRKWGSTSIPLGAVFGPVESVLSLAPTKSLAAVPLAGAAFVPPVSVKKVAKAAVAAATDPAVPAGPMDVWAIAQC